MSLGKLVKTLILMHWDGIYGTIPSAEADCAKIIPFVIRCHQVGDAISVFLAVEARIDPNGQTNMFPEIPLKCNFFQVIHFTCN